MKILAVNTGCLLAIMAGIFFHPGLTFATLITLNADILLDTGVSAARSDDRYWIRNPGIFSDTTFAGQQDRIESLNSDSNFFIDQSVGPWRMAMRQDLDGLLGHNSIDDIWHSFVVNNDQGLELLVGGRYDASSQQGSHASLWIYQSMLNYPDILYGQRGGFAVPDQYSSYRLGAWVTADALPVPEPATFFLCLVGLFFGFARLKRGNAAADVGTGRIRISFL